MPPLLLSIEGAEELVMSFLLAPGSPSRGSIRRLSWPDATILSRHRLNPKPVEWLGACGPTDHLSVDAGPSATTSVAVAGEDPATWIP